MRVRILQAVTSVRVGDGSSASAINLPLSRERHTRWPCFPGSTIKGALRIRASLHDGGDAPINAVFGGEPSAAEGDEESSALGSLVVGGATLLALPVRSLDSTFALLTCPTALARFGRVLGDTSALPQPGMDEAWVSDGGRIQAENGAKGQAGLEEIGAASRGVVVLEDLDLVGVASPTVAEWSNRIGRLIGKEAPLKLLTVVHDDVFAHACTAWTEHRTRNAVGPDGVVEDKKLFIVESFPAETLWWSTLSGEDHGLLPIQGETFVLGGHQSVGLGRVAWYGGEA
jgi:CRISPR-associated protein Cmr4